MPPALLGARFSFGNQSTPPPLPRSWPTNVVCEKPLYQMFTDFFTHRFYDSKIPKLENLHHPSQNGRFDELPFSSCQSRLYRSHNRNINVLLVSKINQKNQKLSKDINDDENNNSQGAFAVWEELEIKRLLGEKDSEIFC
nr:11596_t:CDS:2 [Entrophospora candida]